MKLLGTPLCILCDEAVDRLKSEGISYEYLNFTESIEKLKEFTSIRDNRKEFDHAKATGHIGIPCFLFEDDYITFDIEEAIGKVHAGEN